MSFYLGIDVGTSGCRVVAYDEEFRRLAKAVREYPVLAPRLGWAELDPEAALEAVLQASAAVLGDPALRGRRPVAVGLATLMHTLLLLDAEGRPLGNALLWSDLRAAAEARELREAGLVGEFYRRTGCPVHPMYLPAKLLWFRRHAPEALARAARAVTLKDYLAYRLTGRSLLDHSSASATGLLNLATLDWDDAVLSAVGVERDLLSPLVSPLTVLEGFTTDRTRQQGLPPGVPLVLGATDGTLSNPGAGAVLPGQMAAMIGSSAAVRIVTDRPVLDPQGRTWCYHLLPGHWVPGGATNNGGNILQWYRDRFGREAVAEAQAAGLDPYGVLSAQAATVPPGSRGLLFLPFLAGERSPGWNPDARGLLFGLTLNHGPAEMVRALFEGVVYQLYSVYEALVELVGPPREVRAAGGVVDSPEWLQIMADVFGLPLAVPQEREGSAFGAAALAMLALGKLEGLEEVSRFIRVERVVEPNPARTNLYRELYGMYLELYRKLGPEFGLIAAFQTRVSGESPGVLPLTTSAEGGDRR